MTLHVLYPITSRPVERSRMNAGSRPAPGPHPVRAVRTRWHTLLGLRPVAGVLAVWLLAGWVSPGAAVAVTVPADRPDEVVEQALKQVLAVLNSEDAEVLRRDTRKLNTIIYDIILPVFDFRAFAKLSLGKYWRTASAEQRERYVKAFQSYLIRDYTKYLADYGGTRVRLLPNHSGGDGRRWKVASEVTIPGKQSLPVDFYLWRHDGQWKVYNVTVGGINLVQLFRGSFGDMVRSHGLDALIERMEAGTLKPELDEKVHGVPG